MAELPGAYRTVFLSRLRAQLSYPGSLALDVLSSVLAGFTSLAEVYIVFHNVPALGGLDLSAALVVFAFTYLAFGLANAVAGQLDNVPQLIRTGTLDVLLVRPMPVLGQLLVAEVALKRLGQCAVAAAVLPFALAGSPIDWTPARAGLAVLTPLCGALIFASVFLLAGAVQFWLVDGGEFTNAVTYGGSYAASVPTSVLPMPVRVFFTFVIPAGFVGYLPVLSLAPELGTGALATWLGWCLPLVAVVTAGLALLAWRTGLRRYAGAGG